MLPKVTGKINSHIENAVIFNECIQKKKYCCIVYLGFLRLMCETKYLAFGCVFQQSNLTLRHVGTGGSGGWADGNLMSAGLHTRQNVHYH